MADPHIQSPMDSVDYLTVIIYRLGFVLATLMLPLSLVHPHIAYVGILIASTMLASSVHLYLKNYRLIFQYVMWLGLLLALIGSPALALGCAFFVIGGLSFKEYFCFRIFGLNFQPILMALLWVSLQLQWIRFSQLLTAISTLLLLLLSIQKWRMPLHFDIGDKSKYQI